MSGDKFDIKMGLNFSNNKVNFIGAENKDVPDFSGMIDTQIEELNQAAAKNEEIEVFNNLPVFPNAAFGNSVFEKKEVSKSVLEEIGWTGDNLEKDLEILNTLKNDGYDVQNKTQELKDRIQNQDKKGKNATKWLQTHHGSAYSAIFEDKIAQKEEKAENKESKKLSQEEVKKAGWTGNNMEKDLELLADYKRKGYDISEMKEQLAARLQRQVDKGNVEAKACLEGKHAKAYIDVFSEYKPEPEQKEFKLQIPLRPLSSLQPVDKKEEEKPKTEVTEPQKADETKPKTEVTEPKKVDETKQPTTAVKTSNEEWQQTSLGKMKVSYVIENSEKGDGFKIKTQANGVFDENILNLFEGFSPSKIEKENGQYVMYENLNADGKYEYRGITSSNYNFLKEELRMKAQDVAINYEIYNDLLSKEKQGVQLENKDKNFMKFFIQDLDKCGLMLNSDNKIVSKD